MDKYQHDNNRKACRFATHPSGGLIVMVDEKRFAARCQSHLPSLGKRGAFSINRGSRDHRNTSTIRWRSRKLLNGCIVFILIVVTNFGPNRCGSALQVFYRVACNVERMGFRSLRSAFTYQWICCCCEIVFRYTRKVDDDKEFEISNTTTIAKQTHRHPRLL